MNNILYEKQNTTWKAIFHDATGIGDMFVTYAVSHATSILSHGVNRQVDLSAEAVGKIIDLSTRVSGNGVPTMRLNAPTATSDIQL